MAASSQDLQDLQDPFDQLQRFDNPLLSPDSQPQASHVSAVNNSQLRVLDFPLQFLFGTPLPCMPPYSSHGIPSFPGAPFPLRGMSLPMDLPSRSLGLSSGLMGLPGRWVCQVVLLLCDQSSPICSIAGEWSRSR
ncbi:hypothetical protein R1flu_011408 [Riccia fluitans]|uniref:Uncharacterized protein n=1 Tax=Riccia fluitans TaxID=41844 RepID=A0ABD1Z7Q6_9MARC